MNLHTKTSLVDGQNSRSFDSQGDGRGYTEGSQAIARLATEANREAVELRLALLSRAIEDEIIPRLMLAHPTAGDCLPAAPMKG